MSLNILQCKRAKPRGTGHVHEYEAVLSEKQLFVTKW